MSRRVKAKVIASSTEQNDVRMRCIAAHSPFAPNVELVFSDGSVKRYPSHGHCTWSVGDERVFSTRVASHMLSEAPTAWEIVK